MKLYLAPMEGITTFVYRNALQHYYGGIDKYFTPFLCNKKLDYKDKNDVAPENNDKLYIVPQVLTNQADTFLSIAGQLADRGYREVNLNLGCPSGTVTAKKRGAGFLAVPDLLDAFLEEIFDKCPLSISIKTRIGVESLEEWEALCRIYAKYPLKELIIHTRLQKEYYSGVTHPIPFRFLCATTAISFPLRHFPDWNRNCLRQESPLLRLCLAEGSSLIPRWRKSLSPPIFPVLPNPLTLQRILWHTLARYRPSAPFTMRFWQVI